MNYELILAIISAALVILSLRRSIISKKINLTIAAVLTVLVIIHILIQGARWQMTAVYGYAVFSLFQSILSMRKKSSVKNSKLLLMVFWLVLMFITVFLLLIFPYNVMPRPEGPFAVGTLSFDITDTGRTEIYGDSKGGPRKIRVQVWYPAAGIEGAEKNKWLTDGTEVAAMVPKFAGMPEFMLKYTARIEANSFENAAVLDPGTARPVVIISHGWLGFRNLHSDFGELLASNGYIAVGIDHSYGSMAAVLDDGTVIRVDPDALPGQEDPAFQDYAERLVTTYSLDAKLVIDVLTEFNSGVSDNTTIRTADFFKDCIDIDSIGLIGHSTGGGGVVRLAVTDDRVKAVFGLDPWVEPVETDILEHGLALPSVFIRSEQWLDRRNNHYLQIIEENPRTETLMYQLNGSSHQDFTMMYMFAPLGKIVGFAGELNSRRSSEIQRDFILSFFDSSFMNSDQDYTAFADSCPELVDIYWAE